MAANVKQPGGSWAGITEETKNRDREMAKELGREVRSLPIDNGARKRLIVAMLHAVFMIRRRKVNKGYIAELADKEIAADT